MIVALAGELRHLVTIQRVAETNEDDGTVSRSWATLTTRYANILPMRGKEFFEAQALGGKVTHKMQMHSVSGITPKDRITFDSRTFNIEFVIDLEERGVMQELMCHEVV